MGKVRADFHNHLRTGSKLRNGDFDKAIDIASMRLGPAGIFGMVNFSDERYEKFISLRGYDRTYIGEDRSAVYVPDKKIMVVKGQEVPTKQGHLLVLGIGCDEHLKDERSLEDTIKQAKDMNSVIIADHPFYIEGIGNYLKENPDLLRRIDAIEVYNGEAAFGLPFGPLNSKANEKAWNFYNAIQNFFPDLGALCSSDGHSFYELGKHWTEIGVSEVSGFNNSLRKSIQDTNLDNVTAQNRFIGKMAAVDHIAKLIWYKSLQKMGYHKNFENLLTN